MIYGPQFAHLEGAAVLIAFGYILTGSALGPVLVLKQTRNTHRLFFAQIVTLVVSLSTVTVLTLHFGLTGAAWATIATGAGGCGQRVVESTRSTPLERRPAARTQPGGC